MRSVLASFRRRRRSAERQQRSSAESAAESSVVEIRAQALRDFEQQYAPQSRQKDELIASLTSECARLEAVVAEQHSTRAPLHGVASVRRIAWC